MESISEIINYIGRTNLFNFVIFLAIIIFVCKKINVTGKLEAAKKDVVNNIENSKAAKSDSESTLKAIEESVAHIEEEIDEIIKKAEENARMVGGKILEDAEKSVENIKYNSKKTADARAGLIKNDIMRRASAASVDVAKNHIINELRNNPELHNKLIDESVEAINGVEIWWGQA